MTLVTVDKVVYRLAAERDEFRHILELISYHEEPEDPTARRMWVLAREALGLSV